MLYRLLGDALVVLHVAFIAFVVGGSLLVLRRRRVALLHLPCALWAALISLYGGTCPLTPLEKELRERGGEIAYSGGFVEHYLMPVLYPVGLTRDLQILLGAAVLVWTASMYGIALRSRRAPVHEARMHERAPQRAGYG
jgi:hypothetical protein